MHTDVEYAWRGRKRAFSAFPPTESARMALKRGNGRLPRLQSKIHSENGRSVFSQSGIG